MSQKNTFFSVKEFDKKYIPSIIREKIDLIPKKDKFYEQRGTGLIKELLLEIKKELNKQKIQKDSTFTSQPSNQ
jgi:hypothetical protein